MGRALGFNGPYGLTDSKFKGSMARAVSRTRSSVSVFEVIGLKVTSQSIACQIESGLLVALAHTD